MKLIVTAFAVVALAAPLHAASHAETEISDETVEKILAMLTKMECQMDPDDIEREHDGYELDDVICKGGLQFDIELDGDLNETGRRAE